MSNIAVWVGASVIVAGSAFCPQKSLAEGFTGTEFLEWSIEGQDGYIRTSIVMATMVAGRSDPAKATCLDNWYAASNSISAERNLDIRNTIKRNASHHPSAVILLMMEQACGSFGDDD